MVYNIYLHHHLVCQIKSIKSSLQYHNVYWENILCAKVFFKIPILNFFFFFVCIQRPFLILLQNMFTYTLYKRV